MFYCMKLGIYAGLKKVFALCDVGFCIVAIVVGKVLVLPDGSLLTTISLLMSYSICG